MKRYKKFLRIGAIAASLLIILGAIFTNESLKSKIKPLFSFNDENNLTKENIDIKLDSYFYNSYKLGLSFKLKFNNSKPLMDKDFDRVLLYFSLKNGNGEYIVEFLSSDKPLMNKDNSSYIFEYSNPVVYREKGEVQCDVLVESCSGDIPKLEDAEIKIDNVIIIYKNTSEDGQNRENFNFNSRHKIIEGNWNLELNDSNQKEIKAVEYLPQDNKSNINVISSKVSLTSLNVSIALNNKFKNRELLVARNIMLIDESGLEYKSNGYEFKEKNGNTIFSVRFPISYYESSNRYRLTITDIGLITGVPEFKRLVPDIDVELVKTAQL
jgi:hypothetical protein